MECKLSLPIRRPGAVQRQDAGGSRLTAQLGECPDLLPLQAKMRPRI